MLISNSVIKISELLLWKRVSTVSLTNLQGSLNATPVLIKSVNKRLSAMEVGLFSSPAYCLVINALGRYRQSSNWSVNLENRKKPRGAPLLPSPVKRVWSQRMPRDLLHYKMGCWSLPSPCFASSHPQSRWSRLGRCSRPPAVGPR